MSNALFVSLAADWIGTFAIHSTVVLAVALLVARLLRRRAIAVQEHVLHSSLWLALVSTTLQVFVVGVPWSSNFALPSVAPVVAEVPAEPAPLATSVAPLPDNEPVASPGGSGDVSWAVVVCAAAVVFAACGLSWLWNVHRRLRRVLAERSPELDPRVLRVAAEVARESGLRQTPHLSRCPAIATPIAFGWVRPEICLPARASELGDPSLRAMIAHEIAHLRRGDPASMWLAAALQALFPWQLLAHVVRRRWERLVELRCDAIAAGHSSSTAVARCLLDVAEWLRPDARHPGIALAMAARPSSLRERVEAALRPQGVSAAYRSLSASWSVASLAALTLVSPGLQSGAATDVVDPASIVLSSDERLSSLVEVFTELESERLSLVAEMEELQRDNASMPRSADLEALHAVLRLRLSHLEQTSARLRARLARSSSEAR